MVGEDKVAERVLGGALSGTLPFDTDSAIRLTAVVVGNNFISGSLPNALAARTALNTVLVSHNKVATAFAEWAAQN